MSISHPCLSSVAGIQPMSFLSRNSKPSLTSRVGIPDFSIREVRLLPANVNPVQICRPVSKLNGVGWCGRVERSGKLGFFLKAGIGEEKAVVEEEVENGRRESTMPERFRYLTKEAPDPPVRWPWFVALGFLAYAWRAVLFELSNWKRNVIGIFQVLGYAGKLVLALILHFVGDPITSTVRCAEEGFYAVRAFYSSIIAYAPIPELITIIVLSSITLAIAEAAVPDVVSSQRNLLTISGLIAYFALRGFISEPFFWTLLLGIYGFSRFFKKKDDVSAALPAAAVMTAIGEPWVRVLVLASFTVLAITHHSKKLSRGKADVEASEASTLVPLPLLAVALAIGIRVAAKWAGYRHLTWMIV